MSSYQVALDVYEGPLDVLLRLIERDELDITLVSLALVADQFLAHVARLRDVQAANLAEFLVIAARLLVLKSRVLLPQPEQIEEEDEGDWEHDLLERLRQYKRFKDVAAQLRALEARGLKAYPRMAPTPKLEPRLEPGVLSLTDLVEAFRHVLEAHPPTPPVDDVVAPVVIHIWECIANIRARLKRYGRIRFSTLMGRARSRTEIIVTFLAMLELIKLQRVRAVQEQVFGEIYIEEREPDPDVDLGTLDLSEYGEDAPDDLALDVL